MKTIAFGDGSSMPWLTFRAMMMNEISPSRAVALSRPKMALDAAPRWQARDQAAPPARWDEQGPGLSRTYVDATNNYLRDAGLSDEDCQAVAAILEKYAAAAEDENLEMAPEKQIRVGGPRGPVGNADRGRLAHDEFDMHGQARRVLARAMPLGGDDRGFAARFPGAERIRTV